MAAGWMIIIARNLLMIFISVELGIKNARDRRKCVIEAKKGQFPIMMNWCVSAFLAVFFINSANSIIVPCTEYNAYAQYHSYAVYYTYYYSCGWWGWYSCSAGAYYTGYYATYYSQLDCCPGHGGETCIPICNTPCGTNKECSAPQTCTCVEGWEGSDCLTDIDECAKMTDICEYRSTCENIAGSYNCDCPDPSDRLATDGRRCLSPVTDLVLIPDRREITVQWSHPLNLTDDGEFDYYRVECMAEDNTTVIYSTSDNVGWVNEFVVGPVTPFRNYSCGVTVVTKANGESHSFPKKIQTLQDSPDGPPLNVRVETIDSKILAIFWDPPAVPNGIIDYHRLYINYMNTSRIYEIEVEPEYNLFFLEFLYPHQTVAIGITGTTAGGEGPQSAWVQNTTAQAEPGRVSDIDVAIVSDNSAQVTWNPPVALNGIVQMYHIYLYKVENGELVSIEEWELDHDDELSVKVFNLMPYVPYKFTVIASTIAGKGEIAPFEFFTRQDTPKVSPSVTTANRASADQIYLVWDRLNEDDLQGFFVDYVIKYYTTAVHSDCSSPMDEATETTTDKYLLLKNLDPHTAYCVKIAASTTAGTGVYTDLMFIDEIASSKFELHLNGIHECARYVHDNADATNKLNQVADQLTDVLNGYCKCNVQTTYFGDMRFICANNDENRVLVQGSIVGTALASSEMLIQYLEQWRMDTPVLVILGLQVYVNASCGVALEDFGSHTQCDVPTVEDPSALMAEAGSSEANTGYIAGAIAGIVVAVILIIVIVIVIIGVVLVRTVGRKGGAPTEVKFVNSQGRMGVSNPIGGEGDYDEKELVANMDD